MSEPILSLEINICDAVGCSATATEEIKVSVGQLGDIHLSVCANCRPKFVTHFLDEYKTDRIGQ